MVYHTGIYTMRGAIEEPRAVFEEPRDIHFEPPQDVVVVRVAISSAVIIGAWLVGSIAVRAIMAASNTVLGHYPQSS